MHGPRILNRATQASEAQGFDEGTSPPLRPTSGQTGPRALQEQAAESSFDVLVDSGEVVRGVARAKVLGPTAEHRIEIRNHHAEIRVTPRPGRQVSHTRAHPRHCALRRPALE